jgi:hypothetical protein
MLPKLRPESVRAASEGVREVLELLLPCTVQEPAKEAPLKEMVACAQLLERATWPRARVSEA